MLGEECEQSVCVLNVHSDGDVVLQQNHLEMIQVPVCCGPLLQPLVLPQILCSSSEELQAGAPPWYFAVQSLGHLWSCRKERVGQEVPEGFLTSVKWSYSLVNNCGAPSAVFAQVPLDGAPPAATSLPHLRAMEIIFFFFFKNI